MCNFPAGSSTSEFPNRPLRLKWVVRFCCLVAGLILATRVVTLCRETSTGWGRVQSDWAVAMRIPGQSTARHPLLDDPVIQADFW